MSPNLIGVFALLMWSSMTLIIAICSGIPPFQLAAMSWFLGFVLLGAYYLSKGESLLSHFNRPVSDYLFVGTGVCVYTMLIYSAFYFAPPFEAHALNYLWPIFLTVFLALFQRETLTAPKIFGFLLGFAGCALLFFTRYDTQGEHSFGIGHVMAITGAIIWALYSCFAKSRDYPSGFMVPIFLLSFIVCVIGHLLFELTVWPTQQVWGAILLLGSMRIAYVFWDHAIRRGNRQMLSSLVYLVPLASTVLMVLGGYGAKDGAIYIAAGLIVAGCLVVNFQQIMALFSRKARPVPDIKKPII